MLYNKLMENTESFKIRLMEKEDAAPVFDLYKKVWSETYVSEENNIFKKDIKDFYLNKSPTMADSDIVSDENILKLVVTYKDKIIATSNTFRLKNSPKTLYLKTLYIDPDFQRKGIGHDIIEFIKNYFKNFEIIFLDTATYNIGGINFYLKNNFKIDENWSGTFPLVNDKNIPLVRLVYRL